MSDPTNVPPTHPGGGPLPRPRSRTWPMVLLGLVILICGNIIGAGTAVLLLKPRMQPLPPPPGNAVTEIVDDLRARHNLTDKQAAKVRDLMQASIEVLEGIRRDSQQKAEAQREKLRAEMKTVLTPEQYRQWLARFEELGARRGPPGGPGGQGRPGMDGPGMGGRPGMPQPGQGPGPGRPGMGGGPPGQGQGPGRPQPPGMDRRPGPEGGPMRPPRPEDRWGPQQGGFPPAGNRPEGLEPINPPRGPEAARPQEPPPGQQ